MSGGFLIAVDNRSAAPETDFVGLQLSRQAKRLERLAKKINVQPLTSFISLDEAAQEEMRELVEESGGDVSDWRLEPMQWFTASDGLTTVRALLNHLSKDSEAIRNSSSVLDELAELERALIQIGERDARWRFWIDS